MFICFECNYLQIGQGWMVKTPGNGAWFSFTEVLDYKKLKLIHWWEIKLNDDSDHRITIFRQTISSPWFYNSFENNTKHIANFDHVVLLWWKNGSDHSNQSLSKLEFKLAKKTLASWFLRQKPWGGPFTSHWESSGPSRPCVRAYGSASFFIK